MTGRRMAWMERAAILFAVLFLGAVGGGLAVVLLWLAERARDLL